MAFWLVVAEAAFCWEEACDAGAHTIVFKLPAPAFRGRGAEYKNVHLEASTEIFRIEEQLRLSRGRACYA